MEDERRFKRILLQVLVLFLLFSIVMPYLPVSQTSKEKTREVPPRFAKLIMERKPPPPPVEKPAPKQVEAKAKPKPKPKPKKQEQPKPKPKPKAKLRPKSTPKPVKSKEEARRIAEQSGVLALKDELADLRENSALASLTKHQSLSTSGSKARKSERSMITSNLSKGSGGINTASLSRDTGGAGLASRATTKVTSTVGGGSQGAAQGGPRKRGSGSALSRTIEEIQVVFDRNKGSIYSLYNRALRKDPTLQGKVVLRLTIAPSGKVTACEIVSSELESTALESKLRKRITLFNFGAKDVESVTITYPIDFLPA